MEKGLNAKKVIEHSFKVDPDVIEVWEVDLSSYESVKAFCKKVNGLRRVDVVCENAGVATPIWEECEGMEKTITVNVISTFLMALLLLPKLRESAARFNMVPRLTIVSSEAHEQVCCILCTSYAEVEGLRADYRVPWQAIFGEQSAPKIFEALRSNEDQPDRYNLSKLFEILTVRSLAPAMAASGKPKVVLNTLSPGFCHSELMRAATFPLNVLAWIGKRLFGRTTEMGSRTLVFAACAGEESHGTYMRDCRVGEVSAWVRSEKGAEAQRRVYDELLSILEGIEPGITKNI